MAQQACAGRQAGAPTHLCVEHDGAHDARLAAGGAQVVQRLLVVLVAAVGEVEARDVHAAAQHLAQDGDAARAGAGGRAVGQMRQGRAQLAGEQQAGRHGAHSRHAGPRVQMTCTKREGTARAGRRVSACPGQRQRRPRSRPRRQRLAWCCQLAGRAACVACGCCADRQGAGQTRSAPHCLLQGGGCPCGRHALPACLCLVHGSGARRQNGIDTRRHPSLTRNALSHRADSIG